MALATVREYAGRETRRCPQAVRPWVYARHRTRM